MTSLALLALAACAETPPARTGVARVVHLTDHPDTITELAGTLRLHLPAEPVELVLEPRESTLGLPCVALPLAPAPESLELFDEADRRLELADLAAFAAGVGDYALVAAARHHSAADLVRVDAELVRPDHHSASGPPSSWVTLRTPDSRLEATFPVAIEEHRFVVTCRATGSTGARLAVRRGQTELASAALVGGDRWHEVPLSLRLEPGLERLVLSAPEGEVHVASVALLHADRDLVLLREDHEGTVRVRLVPADPPPSAPVHRGEDGLVFARPGDAASALGAGTGVEPLEPPPHSRLAAFRVSGPEGWVRVSPPADGVSAADRAEDAELWREREPEPPADALAGLALRRASLGGDHRPSFWLPAGSRLVQRVSLRGARRLKFAVGRPEGSRTLAPPERPATPVEFEVSFRTDGERIELDRVRLGADDAPRWLDRTVTLPPGLDEGELVFETLGDLPVPAAFADPRLVRPDADGPGPNAIVYVVDTLRADHLSCYGARNPTSPRIDALSAEGFRFANFWAVAPWTRPTTATLLTGYLPAWHGMGRELPLPNSLETLAESLARAGWSTWAAVANPQVGASTLRFSQGFHRFVDPDGIELPGDDGRVATSRQLNRTLLPWLEANADEPFFLYLHSLDPHTPYAPPPDAEAPFGREYRGPLYETSLRREQLLEAADRIGEADRRYVEDMYDNEVHYQDAQVGRLFDRLEGLGLADELVFALLSDHGEEFLDHGDWNHGYRMWNEQLHVPFVLWLSPDLMAARGLAPRVIEPLVSQTDFLPGLLELLGVRDEFPRHGRSWLPLLSGREAELLPYFGQDFQAWEGDEIGAFRRGDAKLVWRRFEQEQREELELYDLGADPGETRDLAAEDPARVERLRAERDAFVRFGEALRLRHLEEGRPHVVPASGNEEPAWLSDEELRELEALGYVHGADDPE